MNFNLNIVTRLMTIMLLTLTAGEAWTRAQRSQITEAQAKAKYDELVKRVRAGDKTVDFVELISAASELDRVSSGIVTAPRRDEMVKAFKNKDYKTATELADNVLNYEFTNRGLHRATDNAYRQLGQNSRADFHRDVADSILNALLSTGDGQTVQTAYCVQSINEEYVIMQHFGYVVNSQALLMSDEVSYDFLSGVDTKTKKSVGLYFDISGNFSRCVQSRIKASKQK